MPASGRPPRSSASPPPTRPVALGSHVSFLSAREAAVARRGLQRREKRGRKMHVWGHTHECSKGSWAHCSLSCLCCLNQPFAAALHRPPTLSRCVSPLASCRSGVSSRSPIGPRLTGGRQAGGRHKVLLGLRLALHLARRLLGDRRLLLARHLGGLKGTSRLRRLKGRAQLLPAERNKGFSRACAAQGGCGVFCSEKRHTARTASLYRLCVESLRSKRR